MNEISKKDQLVYFNFLNSLPKKINKLYFSKLKGKFKLNNKSKKKSNFDPVTNIDRSLELFLRSEISKRFPNIQSTCHFRFWNPLAVDHCPRSISANWNSIVASLTGVKPSWPAR